MQGELGPLITPAAPSLLAPDVELGARQRAEYIARQLQLRGVVRLDALVQAGPLLCCSSEPQGQRWQVWAGCEPNMPAAAQPAAWRRAGPSTSHVLRTCMQRVLCWLSCGSPSGQLAEAGHSTLKHVQLL